MLYTTLTFNGVEKDLASWGISRCTREHKNKSGDTLAFDLQAQFDAPDLFPYGQQIVIQIQRQAIPPAGQVAPAPNTFTGGKQFYVGYRNQHTRYGTGRMEGFKYKFSGIWEFFFERHEYQIEFYEYWYEKGKIQSTLTGISSTVCLGMNPQWMLNTTPYTPGQNTTPEAWQDTIAEALFRVVTWTLNQTTLQYGGQQFQIDPALATCELNGDDLLGWSGYFPVQAAKDIMVSEAIKRCLQLVSQSSAWVDCSTVPPTFRARTRPSLPSVTLPLSSGELTKPNIQRRDDLTPIAIDYKYLISSTTNGKSVQSCVDDIATTVGSTNLKTLYNSPAIIAQCGYVGAVTETFDFVGPQATVVTLNTMPIPFDISDASLLMWKTVLVSALSDASIAGVTWGPDLIQGIVSPATLTDMNGVSYYGTPYQYFMVGGPAPQGLVDPKNPNLPQGIQLTLAQTFMYTELGTAATGSGTSGSATTGCKTERKTVSIYAFTMPGGNFTTAYAPGEVVPYGMAAWVFNIESVPQYEGTFTVTEQDISDVCPMGTNLNISEGLPEWETMNALVQQLSYDLIEGTTEITFGPANHLAPQDMITRLQLNRGPRWKWLLGDAAISGSQGQQAVSGPTQLKDSHGAAVQPNMVWWPAGTPTLDTNLTTPAGVAPLGVGMTINTNPNAITPAPGGTQGTVPASAPGGQLTFNTGKTVPSGQTAAITQLSAGALQLVEWTGLGLSPSALTACVSITVGDLLNILFASSSSPTVTDTSIKLRALQTCETAPSGSVIYRIFACSKPIVVPTAWKPYQ